MTSIEEGFSESPEKQLHSKRLGRELAMQYLFRCDLFHELPDMEQWEKFYDDELKELHHLRDNRYARKAKEYAVSLISQVGCELENIDKAIRERAENWEIERISAVDRNILRVAVCEMLYFDDVPPVVSIDEAVEIAIDYSGEDSGRFINGVLNSIKDTLKRPPPGKEKRTRNQTAVNKNR